jgi:kynurenine formamidase
MKRIILKTHLFFRAFSLIFLVNFFIISCQNEKSEFDRFEQLFNGELNIIDLTHTLNNTSPYWPNEKGNPFKYDTIIAHKSRSPMMGAYSTPEHFGTHLDAPIHGGDNLKSVEQLTAKDMFGPAVVIDISKQSEINPDYTLSITDILDWEAVNGKLPKGVIVLLYTGWSEKWTDYEAYKNEDKDSKMHFPGFSVDAAQFLIDERDIRGIGIDNMSVDAAQAKGFPVHGIINGSGKYQLENVANLRLLPPTGTFLIVAPIKIQDGSGGQVRLFAVVP